MRLFMEECYGEGTLSARASLSPLGQMQGFQRDPLAFLENAAHEYGDIVHFRPAGRAAPSLSPCGRAMAYR